MPIQIKDEATENVRKIKEDAFVKIGAIGITMIAASLSAFMCLLITYGNLIAIAFLTLAFIGFMCFAVTAQVYVTILQIVEEM